MILWNLYKVKEINRGKKENFHLFDKAYIFGVELGHFHHEIYYFLKNVSC